MDKNRFEQLKRITQLEPKHATQLVFTMDDLKWLVSQCEKAEQLEKENEKLKGFVDLNILIREKKIEEIARYLDSVFPRWQHSRDDVLNFVVESFYDRNFKEIKKVTS